MAGSRLRRCAGAVFRPGPGQIAPDTKLDLTANPVRFLVRAASLWNSDLPFGQAQNQAYGYLFPHGAFFLLGHTLGVPGGSFSGCGGRCC